MDGTVYVNGKSADYTLDGRILTVNMGNIAPGTGSELTFKVSVTEEARGATLENIAKIKSDNSGELTAPDDGIKIDEGTPSGSIRKTANVAKAQVGDVVTYTIAASNSITATADWRNVVITDAIPDSFNFMYGIPRGISKGYVRAKTLP